MSIVGWGRILHVVVTDIPDWYNEPCYQACLNDQTLRKILVRTQQ